MKIDIDELDRKIELAREAHAEAVNDNNQALITLFAANVLTLNDIKDCLIEDDLI